MCVCVWVSLELCATGVHLQVLLGPKTQPISACSILSKIYKCVETEPPPAIQITFDTRILKVHKVTEAEMILCKNQRRYILCFVVLTTSID